MPRSRNTRPHPVYSGRFWFLVLAAVGATAAWKLDLLHMHPAARVDEPPAAAVELGESSLSGEPVPGDAEVFLDQTEPAPAPEPPATSAHKPRVIPRPESVAQSPFGTAAPEFVAASSTRLPATPASPAAVPFGRSGSNVTAQETTAHDLPSDVVLAANESAPEAPDAPEVSQADAAAAPAEPAFDFTQIDANLNAGTVDGDVAAHRALSELYWQHPELRPQLYERIDQTAKRIYFQPQPHYFAEYNVQPGETLQAIAKKYSVSWEYLERLNKIKAPRLKAGQSLKVIKGPFGAVVDLSDYEITVHCHGHYVYRFPVGIGKDGSTPIGTFTVEDKVVNPQYNGPEGTIAADDPANPIGERWISLGGGYGIHGTIDPDSIGKSESRGCIRMHNKDVEIVYDLLTVGSEVVIQR